jgi:hypothetical protein
MLVSGRLHAYPPLHILPAIAFLLSWSSPMARQSDLEKMSYAELAELGMHVARLKVDKQNAERATVRQKMAPSSTALTFAS